jgi:hypothetical protein
VARDRHLLDELIVERLSSLLQPAPPDCSDARGIDLGVTADARRIDGAPSFAYAAGDELAADDAD